MHAAVLRRHRLKEDLQRAAERGELVVELQPIVELATGNVAAAEALVRWNHPERGRMTPGDFIDVAEETGRILEVDRFVLEHGCGLAASWPSGEAGAVALHVNVSPRELQRPELIRRVSDALETTGLPPNRLVLEITESGLMRDPRAVLGRLQALRELGVRLAIDDFGTGYSSLSYLRWMPIDVLKMDKSFVDDLSQRRPAHGAGRHHRRPGPHAEHDRGRRGHRAPRAGRHAARDAVRARPGLPLRRRRCTPRPSGTCSSRAARPESSAGASSAALLPARRQQHHRGEGVVPGREPRRPSSREPVQVRPGNRAQTGLVRAPAARRARATPTGRRPRPERPPPSLFPRCGSKRRAAPPTRARRTRARVRRRTNAANCLLIDQDLIDTVLNDSDGSPHLTRPHPRRRRRASRRLAHDGLQRLQPARSAQPHAARAGAQRRARPGLHRPRPGGALAAPRQGRIARARLRRTGCATSSTTPRRCSSSPASPPAARSRAPAWRSSRSCREGAAELVRSALVDGYVMFCTPENDERLEAVRARGLPYVLVDFSPYVDGPRVNIDDRGGARAVAQHLRRPRPPALRARPALRGRRDRRRHRDRGLRPDAHRGPHALALLHPLRAPARLARSDRRRRHRLGRRAGRQLARERRGVRLSRRRAAARPRRSPDRDHLPLRRPGPRRHARRRRSAASASPRTSASSATTTSPRPPPRRSPPSTSPTPPRARRPSACSPPAATTSSSPPTSWSAPPADPPRADHARKELTTCSTCRPRPHRPRPHRRGSSPPARAARPRRGAGGDHAPRPRPPRRRARPAPARRPPRARPALRPAVLRPPSAM